MSRQVNICTKSGECGGECYACRLKRAQRELEAVRELACHLYDSGILSGVHGPWADNWTEQEKELWGLWDEFKNGQVYLTEMDAQGVKP